MKRHVMGRRLFSAALIFLLAGQTGAQTAGPSQSKQASSSRPPIYIAFLWHMHQPVYRPGETILQTDASGRYSYSVVDIHNSRTGPYTTWPSAAVSKGIAAGLPHLGASVSLTGSLIRNLNQLEAAGRGFSGWKNPWKSMAAQKTARGNYRIDLIGFGFHHPLMGLVEYDDIRHQISEHRRILTENFGVAYSKGIFPPENAFTPRMIPALVDEGLEWVLVDNVHFERAAKNYPYSTGGNLYEPNPADQRNPDPADWVQLNGLWAPTRVSARWAHQPHYVAYTDPETGTEKKIVAVPASRYLGNEDGRGGFGALQYDAVMSQLEAYNTDPAHPILIVLHHDGDNFGGGSEGYYGGNFQAFVDWLKANPSRFVGTTIQDYLDQFPVEASDVIHVEDGSWAGADNGDPEFLKWLGKPGADGYSPDRNSWAILTAAKNAYLTAASLSPGHAGLAQAREMLSNAQASDYWYWDGTEIWDSNPAMGANLALNAIDGAWNGATEQVAPTVFIPQRDPYNPGGKMWTIQQPASLSVWTYAFDISGLKRVELKYRIDADGIPARENDVYAKGAGVGAWTSAVMQKKTEGASRTNPLPRFRADRYEAAVEGLQDKLVDYYVEAEDLHGNIRKSPIRTVYAGSGSTGGGGGGSSTVSWTPSAEITRNDTITVVLKGAKSGKLHWGVNAVGSTWTTPASEYRPQGTVLFNGSGPAVQTPFPAADGEGNRVLKLGPFNGNQTVTSLQFVIHFDDNSWDNNGGKDYRIEIKGTPTGGGGYLTPTVLYTANGTLDATAKKLAENGSMSLFADWNGRDLYVATQAAQPAGQDVFLFVAAGAGTLVNAPWSKNGEINSFTAFIGNESTNNWAGWFEGGGTRTVSAGQMLEGVWDLSTQFSTRPDSILLAAVRFGTADNGVFSLAVPAGNADRQITAAEFAVFRLNNPTTVAAERAPQPALPLLTSYPNPFNPATVISLTLPAAGKTTVEVFDLQGRRVASLFAGSLPAGRHSWTFDAAGLSSGLYVVRSAGAGGVLTRKIALVK